MENTIVLMSGIGTLEVLSLVDAAVVKVKMFYLILGFIRLDEINLLSKASL